MRFVRSIGFQAVVFGVIGEMPTRNRVFSLLPKPTGLVDFCRNALKLERSI